MNGQLTSTQVLDEYIARSWRSNAERQRKKGAEFVIGKREGVFMWNLEGTHRLIDCGVGGGVHALGHRHPEVLAELRKALDDGRDTGLWSVPNLPYLNLQDRLASVAPHPGLNRAVITLASTVSVDVAIMFAFRFTGRNKILAFRHGYHGHTGFAAMVTGSPDEGIIDHYNLPKTVCEFFDTYGDLQEISAKLTDEIAAIILEPMDYESFKLANPNFLVQLQAICRERGTLLIIDETRTGLGRTGKLWASQHYDVQADMMVVGKGLSGGLYPVSALMTREDIYETCMNEHAFSYISSLGGNEISCVVADKVLEIASRPETAQKTAKLNAHFKGKLETLAAEHPGLLGPIYAFGAVFTLTVLDRVKGKQIYANLFKHGVLCHSICETEPPAIKFFPPIMMTPEEADLVVDAVRRSVDDL
ncbi:MAG: aminotransferase [Pelagibacterium sp. SCN 64-44]|nr:MAG: aminotransferase [Pelagibacterium sp. SCN 64-44]